MVKVILLLVLGFAAGYAVCTVLGPKIDAEAGVIIHQGEKYVGIGLQRSKGIIGQESGTNQQASKGG